MLRRPPHRRGRIRHRIRHRMRTPVVAGRRRPAALQRLHEFDRFVPGFAVLGPGYAIGLDSASRRVCPSARPMRRAVSLT